MAQFFILTGIGEVAYEVAYQGLGDGGVDTVHGHMIAVVGGPAEGELGEITGTDDHTAGLVGDVHKDLSPFSGLRVFIGDIMDIDIMTDVAQVDGNGFFDVYLF